MAKQSPSSTLTDLEFHALLALADKDLHGYALLQEIRALTVRHRKLRTGTLYATLHRLTALELLEEAPMNPVRMQEDQRRKYYRITNRGRKFARAEAQRLKQLTLVAERKELLEPSVVRGE